MNFQWALHTTGILLLTINFACQKETLSSDTLVYGHAGTTLYTERGVYPPNTVESVIYALDVLDAEGVEVDVQMTKDSVLVLYHDAFLDGHTKLPGCISSHDFATLKGLNVYNSSYKLATLHDVSEICFTRGKKLFLDLKPYDYCASANVDLQVFDRALNKTLAGFSAEQRSTVLVNSRNMDLLMTFTDTNLIRCFETEDIALGIEKFQSGQADELCINAASLTNESVSLLKNAGIKFSTFGVKTQAEVRTALGFKPNRIITDNIAYTQKMTQ